MKNKVTVNAPVEALRTVKTLVHKLLAMSSSKSTYILESILINCHIASVAGVIGTRVFFCDAKFLPHRAVPIRPISDNSINLQTTFFKQVHCLQDQEVEVVAQDHQHLHS
ncbi:60S ribosomal protein L9-A [Frankliniella fusca]|uniref:60S ribosomal protein L9-A n=1 Tax=Frankliniella fusca TaxID=407009 RepID=A0AAE1LUZ1_9NEOP|nr:60S ribosomal protein L9-A [Frankliniella fusca]